MKINLIFLLLLTTPFIALAEELPSNDPIMLKVKMSQTCFHSSQKSQVLGKLDGWACNSDDENQKFTFVPTDNEWFQLKSTKSGLCAEVKNASTRHHVSIVLAKCDKQAHQLWKKNSIDNEWFTLSTKHSAGCLDLDHGVRRNGNRFIWQRCLKQSNKRWFDKQAFKIIKNQKEATNE
jgi:agarase